MLAILVYLNRTNYLEREERRQILETEFMPDVIPVEEMRSMYVSGVSVRRLQIGFVRLIGR